MFENLERSIAVLARRHDFAAKPRSARQVVQRLDLVARMLSELGATDSFFGPTLVWRGESGLVEAMTVNRPIVIGRASNCDLVFSEANVSRWHAEVVPEDSGSERVHLRDLHSTAGTRLNGRRLERPVILGDGDVIELGAAACVFLAAKGDAS